MSRISLSITYDPETGEYDIRRALLQLQNAKGSRYEKRSMNEILKMVLASQLPEIVAAEVDVNDAEAKKVDENAKHN